MAWLSFTRRCAGSTGAGRRTAVLWLTPKAPCSGRIAFSSVALPPDRPQFCPAPSDENIASRSERAIAHQSQITGLPPGLEVKLNDVRFDGCRESDGTMLEAKGSGYADKMDGPQDWKYWFTGAEDIEDQMQAQSGAAIGRIVEWHFAEQPVADYFRNYAEKMV
jgi:hypothetical protein